MSRQADTARRILHHAHIVARDIDQTLAALHDHRGGFPASTPGAAPSTTSIIDLDPDGAVHLTGPEKATTTIDRAALDAVALAKHLRQADKAMEKALAIVERNRPAITDQAVAKKLAADERAIWCHNCASHGISEVREEGRHSCQFCRKFNATWGTYPNLAILEIHARRTVTHQDAVRILDRDQPGWRKTMPKPKSAPKTKTVARRKNGRAA